MEAKTTLLSEVIMKRPTIEEDGSSGLIAKERGGVTNSRKEIKS